MKKPKPRRNKLSIFQRFLLQLPVKKYTIEGASMSPNLKKGQTILVHRYIFSKPQMKDVIVFKKENAILIKRIKTVAENNVWVIGDNAKQSIDSRHFGPIKKADIIGKVFYKS